jgi:phosphosulfolactate synthase (CoM biosynthesis protein A)
MNTFGDVSPEQWRAWRQLTLDNGMKIIYEHHPESNWRTSSEGVPSVGEEIIRGAMPFFEDGAIALMIDHEELEFQGSGAATEIGKVINEFGLNKLIFEVTSPKEGPTRWQEDLTRYVSTFGPDCNVANIMPSQALYVEHIRQIAATEFRGNS